ncbi:snustorr snarlik [Musca autumnalis]|uniref:snustorr snarlik n=1 Tax=Musca autumnalis TaxID=221902 RepID=UPI003CFB89D2
MPQSSLFKQSHHHHLHQQQQFHHQSPVPQQIKQAQLQHKQRPHQLCHYGLSLLTLPVLAILLAQCSTSSALVVPNELPSILSLVYSNIPPIKKGTDSRLGFGFRLGNHADFQVMVELGPQKETRPIGDQDSGSSFNKRQVNRQQQRAVQRDVIKAEQQRQVAAKVTESPQTTNSWLEKWASQINEATTAKKKPVPKSKPYKKTVAPKPVPPVLPSIPQQMQTQAQAIQQLQMLYKMATTTTDEDLTSTTSTTVAPNAQSPAHNIQERLKLYKPPANLGELQILMQKSQAQTKAEITKELMDVNLDE